MRHMPTRLRLTLQHRGSPAPPLWLQSSQLTFVIALLRPRGWLRAFRRDRSRHGSLACSNYTAMPRWNEPAFFVGIQAVCAFCSLTQVVLRDQLKSTARAADRDRSVADAPSAI